MHLIALCVFIDVDREKLSGLEATAENARQLIVSKSLASLDMHSLCLYLEWRSAVSS
jgi:hypothetical protein